MLSPHFYLFCIDEAGWSNVEPDVSALARAIARALWWWMLWLMRREWMRRLQTSTVRMLPERSRERARRHVAAQNAIARRYGLPVLTVSINLLLASAAVTATFMIALHLLDAGALTLPDEMRERIVSSGDR